MSPLLVTILSFSCAIPAFLGLYYYRAIDQKFHPFVWAMCLSLFTETAITIIHANRGPWVLHYVFGNLYYSLNVFFYILFFNRIGIVSKKNLHAFWLVCLATFFVNACFSAPDKSLMFGCTVVFDAITFALAANLLSREVFTLSVPVYKNPAFIISATAILYSAVSIFVNVIFILQQDNLEHHFLFSIHQIINPVSYLLFGWAIICITKATTVKQSKSF